MSRGKRYTGFLSPTKGDRMPKRWAVLAVDSEPTLSSVQKGRPELVARDWTLVGRRNGTVYRCWEWASEDTASDSFRESLRSLLSRRGTVVCICADAVQAMTLLGGWDRLDKGDIVLCRSPLILSDPPTAIKLAIPGLPGKLLLLDARNYGVTVPTGTDAIERLAVIADSLPDMLRGLAMGSLQPTAGGQAMYGYRRSYLSTPVYVHCKAPVLAMEEEALHGGRAECYRLGRVEGPIYELDYSGFYGSIMRDLRVPVMLRYHSDTWNPHGVSELESGYGVIARVKVKTEWPYLPCRKGDITVWPVGAWQTTLCGVELQTAYLSGDLADVYEWASYETAPVLSLYARRLLDYCYGERCCQQPDMRAIGKAMLVSLAGKWCQQNRRWEDRPDATAVHKWGKWHYVDGQESAHLYRSIAGRVQRRTGEGFAPTACPAISAWVYAEGRQLLWQAQLIAGRDQVYYCHTDSLFTSSLGYDRLRANGMVRYSLPGTLTIKGIHEWMDIRGISDYTVPARTVRAGVVQSAGGLIAADGTACYGDTVNLALGESRPPLPILYPSAPGAAQAYRHGVRGNDGSVSPWRV